jgi:hypothetical protein
MDPTRSEARNHEVRTLQETSAIEKLKELDGGTCQCSSGIVSLHKNLNFHDLKTENSSKGL